MDLRIFTEPQEGATYDQLLRVARATEDLGFDAFFRSDHYLALGGGDGRPGPTDAWTTLAGLARETSRIRLGTLVTSATFRHPGPLAITVAQVDQMSGGRLELGLGAGWYDAEHTAFGIPFPPLGERFERLEEQLEILRGMWEATGPYSFTGKHYQLADNPGYVTPAQERLPVIIGGFGPKRTPRLAATFADEFNVPFHDLAGTVAAFERVRAVSSRELVYSAAQVVCVGANDAELDRRARAIGRDPDKIRGEGLAGTPAEVVDKLGGFAAAGATRVYLQVLDLDDLDHLELIAAEVLAQV
jgi:F420-dependent oxidoreductase-like protein